MNTLMRPHESILGNRPAVQRFCILVGMGFIFFGLFGVLHPGFLGLHLSAAHNLINLSCGSMILLSGFADERKRAYIISSALGLTFGVLGFLGFALGRPGFPAVGDMNSDLHLWRVVPDFLELASSDHLFHLCVSFLLLLGAFSWRKSQDNAVKSMIDIQRRG